MTVPAEQKPKLKKVLTDVLIIVVSIAAVLSVVRFVEAGSLTPPGSPASTLNTNQQIFDVLVASAGSTALGSATASAQGDALQITKCIIRKIQGLSCP